jgi:hypothetical protein
MNRKIFCRALCAVLFALVGRSAAAEEAILVLKAFIPADYD